MVQQLTPQEFYNELIKDGIIGSTGEITLKLNNISVIIETKDSIGNMIQDWLVVWATSKNIYLRANPSTQEFPDFYLSPSNEDNLLEIKSFDSNASPNFDIANFDTYHRSLHNFPKKIDANYLIFGYSLKNGVLKIENLNLKKIWEISTYSTEWALKLQVKQNIIYNIRPANFLSTNGRSASTFQSKIDFLNAIQKVLNKYNKTKTTHNNWLDDYKILYKNATGIAL
jgi:type II restriction enzyme